MLGRNAKFEIFRVLRDGMNGCCTTVGVKQPPPANFITRISPTEFEE